MMRFKNKVVIVSGGASGIGKAVCELFLIEGAKVFVLDLNLQEPPSVRGDLHYIKTDITNSQSIADAVTVIESSCDSIDVLCNIAGIELSKSFQDTEEHEWEKVFAVNVKGMFLLSKALLRFMKKSGGSIVNTASISGIVGWPQSAAYCSSKGAVVMLTKQMAVELAEFNIRVNCIAPGTTWTPMLERLFSLEKNPENAKDRIKKMHPLGRFASPEEIGKTILFLASEKASFITGVCLPVDGGYTAK